MAGMNTVPGLGCPGAGPDEHAIELLANTPHMIESPAQAS